MRASSIPSRIAAAMFVWLLFGFAYHRADLRIVEGPVAHARYIEQRAAESGAGRRLIVLGGSTAIYGIVGNRMESATGMTVIEAGSLHEMYSYSTLFRYAERLVRSGDIVIYESPALLGLNKKTHAREGAALSFALDLPSGRWAGGHPRPWATVPAEPLVVSLYNVPRHVRPDPAALYTESALAANCARVPARAFSADPRLQAEFVSAEPQLQTDYFRAAGDFFASLKKKGAHVFFIAPTLLVADQDKSAWQHVLRDSAEALRAVGAELLILPADQSFLTDPDQFCDGLHVKRGLAAIRTDSLVRALRARGALGS